MRVRVRVRFLCACACACARGLCLCARRGCVCDVIVMREWHRMGKAPRQIRSCLSPVFFLPAIVGLRHRFGGVHSLWVNDYSTILCV